MDTASLKCQHRVNANGPNIPEHARCSNHFGLRCGYIYGYPKLMQRVHRFSSSKRNFYGCTLELLLICAERFRKLCFFTSANRKCANIHMRRDAISIKQPKANASYKNNNARSNSCLHNCLNRFHHALAWPFASAALMTTVATSPTLRLFESPSGGNSIEKVVPLFSPGLVTAIYPRCSCTICFATYSPNPVPSVLNLAAPPTRENFLNSFSSSPSLSPRPVSCTENVTFPLCIDINTSTFPCVVYLMALSIKFIITCRMRWLSTTTFGITSVGS